MSTPPRIDELRKKFDENPRRYFAPLANEYRKAGDLPQAIALCREFLPKQPGHMSGHIVFGQALYEAGELGEARSVFESALALDPENLIALRHLGDIAKTNGDAAGARRWYERVLDADPRNDDIAAQLATLGTGNTPISVPAYSDAARDAARRPAMEPPSPVSFTPAYGIGIGMDVLPTPDSSMRAVDFDEVNARISGQTPLYTPAQPEPWTPPPSPVESASSSARFEPLDLDAMDAADDSALESAHDVAPSAEDESESPESELAESESVESVESVSDDQPAWQPEWQSAAQWSAPETSETPDAAVTGADTPPADVEMPAAAQDVPAWHEVPPIGIGAAAARDDDEQAFAMPTTHQERVGMSDDRMSDDRMDDDPFGMSDDDGSYSASAVAEYEEDAFEDGLLAPEWPDASDIIARIGTPRSMTPVVSDSMPDAGTPSHGVPSLPHAVPVTPDAVAAFGREPDEPEHVSEWDADDSLHDVRSLVIDEAAPAATAPHAFADADAAQHAVDAQDGEPVIGEVEDGAGGAMVDAGEDEVSFAEVMAQVPDAPEMGFENDALPADDAADEAAEGAAEHVADDAEDDPEPAAAELQTSAAFVTETMGELLVAQGFVERAVGVYEELVRRRPYDPVLTSRLAELRAQLSADAEGAARTTPLHSTPLHNTPLHNTPLYSTPLHNTPRHSTPSWNVPLRATPRRNTPLSVPPYATPAMGAFSQQADESQGALTSRELFARLAARRVPRRTPPHSAPGITESTDGLATLFGGPATAHDDQAARALADAFAPIPAAEMASGDTLDFAIERPSLAPTPLSSPAITPPQNAGFSFDRFFPDRALQQPDARTPSAGSNTGAPSPQSTSTVTPPGSAAPPATEDLAQFSAWLKGLGNP